MSLKKRIWISVIFIVSLIIAVILCTQDRPKDAKEYSSEVSSANIIEAIEENGGVAFVNGFGAEKVIYVENNKLYVDYSVEGISGSFDMGLMVFIDGLPHQFSISNHTPQFMQTLSVQPYSKTDMTLEIDLKGSDLGKKHSLHISYLINPDSTNESIPEIFDSDSVELFEYDSNIIPESKQIDVTLVGEEFYDSDANNGVEIPYGISLLAYSPENDVLSISFWGETPAYRTTIFVDHKPISEGADISYIATPEHFQNITRYELILNAESLTEAKRIYAISVPYYDIENADLMPVKTNTLVKQ